ncbi:MAG: hypothetical protein HYT94_03610 [Parcubacteria group bacterium]|nr:hypothetical protein [Parcubacteria group bacterium]
MKNKNILSSFDLKNIPDLDVAVLGALELFQEEKLPKLKLGAFTRPLVVGSGNAEATGRIIFEDQEAIFASESNYGQKLENMQNIDSVIVISASGGKHAPIIAKRAKESGKNIVLLTNNPHAEAMKFVEASKTFVFPKNREPYTYNTSTYMGMILGKTGEDARSIQNFISERIDTLAMPDFSKYDKYFLIVPTQFSGIIRMLQVKFIELFGRRIAREVETSEYMKHAVTVVPSDELFVSFGDENTVWGKPENRLHIPLPENAGYAAMMAIGFMRLRRFKKSIPHISKRISPLTPRTHQRYSGVPFHRLSSSAETRPLTGRFFCGKVEERFNF